MISSPMATTNITKEDGQTSKNIDKIQRQLRRHHIVSASDEVLNKALFEFFRVVYEAPMVKKLQINWEVVTVVAAYGFGEWMVCCKESCKETVSFVEKMPYGKPEKCAGCRTPNYYWYCEKLQKEITIPRCDGPYCDICDQQTCYEMMRNCKKCDTEICDYCTVDTYCLDCHKKISS